MYTFTSRWMWQPVITDPNPGEVTSDTGSVSTLTVLNLADTSESNPSQDVGAIVAAMVVDDVIRLDAVSASPIWTWDVAAVPTKVGRVWYIPVKNAVGTGGGSMPPNTAVDIGVIMANPPIDPAPTDPSTLLVTLDLARDNWPDAPLDDARLTWLLTVAQERCLAFLGDPVGLTEPTVAKRIQYAIISDASDLWGNEYAVMDQMGMPGQQVTLPAMSRKVKNSLRPPRGVLIG